MTQTDEKISYIPGFQELIMSKWPEYPGQLTGSIQPLSKYQEHFSQN